MKAWFGKGRLAGIVLILVLVALRIADPEPVSALRFAAFDLFQQIKPREVEPMPVAIVDIDDSSLEELGQWPWPRTLIARLVTASREAGAVAVAMDIIFAEPDRLSPDLVAADHPALPPQIRADLAALQSNDEVLAAAMRQMPVVVGQTSVRSGRTALAADTAPPSVPHAILGEDPRPFMMAFPDLVENLATLEAAAAGRGVFTTRPDPDGTYRRVPLVMLVDNEVRLGLSPELLRVATGGQAFAIRANEAGIDGVVVGGQLVQTAPDGSVWPYFSPHSESRYVSAADLIEGRMPQGRLAGHLVLVGTSAIGLEDFRPTPLGVSMAGVEIHAQVLENILLGSILIRPNYMIAVELVTLISLALLVVVLVPIMPARWIIILATLLLVGYAGLSWYLFAVQRSLLDPTAPILGTLATLMLMSTANYLREERQRRAIRTAFGQYVSPDLVERLNEDPSGLALGGERRELTVLFSDVRGFTTLSESFKEDPAGLTHLMNRFLSVLSHAILDHSGTIDKFMGDAVMAFWNAPLDHEQHALSACRAALRMRADIARLNEQRAREASAQGETALPIDVGIGLNTGSCVVGNMGSDMRFDYTALGDAVNLASRLEGQSKTYGVGIILGSATATAVEGTLALIEIDLIRVKGKLEPDRIYTLLGDEQLAADPGFQALAAANSEMRAAYAAQNWQDVKPLLDVITSRANSLGLDLDGYLDLYRDRLSAFLAAPPLKSWDGVYVAEVK